MSERERERGGGGEKENTQDRVSQGKIEGEKKWKENQREILNSTDD